MKRIFTTSVFAAALVVASSNAFAQDCSPSQPNPSVCSGNIANDFNATDQGFGTTNGSFTYSSTNGRFELNNIGANLSNQTATFTSPMYIKTATMPGAVTAGLTLTAGSRSTISAVLVEILDANTNSVISSCTPTFSSLTSGSSSICVGITDPADLLTGRRIKYRFTISYSTVGNPVAERFIAVDNFSYGGNSNAPLPVKFSSFEGKSVNGGVNLTWNVGTEENVGRYDVEKSADNRTFVTIGSVDANGRDTYSFVDAKASAATAYYRIKGVDVDGKLTYSPIVTMKGGKSLIAMRAFPMPVISDLTLQHATASAGSLISISSAEGREVKSVIPAKGSQQTVISLTSLTPGMYVIRYSNINGEVESLKIVKQ